MQVKAALRVCMLACVSALMSAPVLAQTQIQFGFDAPAISRARELGLPVHYGSTWAGSWIQRYGWGGVEADVQRAAQAGVTPVVHWWYWGDDISPACVESGCMDRYQGVRKDRETWNRLARELAALIGRSGGGRAVVVLETEFNKNGIETYEPFDGYLLEQIGIFRAQGATVVLGFGDWGAEHWSTFDRAAGAADMLGTSALRSSVRNVSSYLTAVEQIRATAAHFLNAFGKLTFVSDLAFSSYPAAGYEAQQAAAITDLFARMGDLAASGVRGIVWRMLVDDPVFDTSNYHGTAERHWGFLRADGSQKPAFQTLLTSLQQYVTGPPPPVPPVAPPVAPPVQPPAALPAAPFGAFDHPVDHAVVSGSLAVTGWALDDVAVDRVEIWRNAVANDPAPPFRQVGHPADGKVFITNGTFVEGTRPDVEGIYTTAPNRRRAGWGYMLLTQGLPRSNGTFVLTVLAWDRENRATVLGTKAIVVDNASSTRPFGSIDVPAYGATFSGHQYTYGWALTPNAGCTMSGGQLHMTIDSAPPNFPVTYGANRTDIAATFPGLRDSHGAGGAVALDSRRYTNGTHAIGWLVYDSCGNGEGIGSRFFTIQNGSGDAAGRAAADSGTHSNVIEGTGPSFPAVGRSVGAVTPPVSGEPLWLVRGMGTQPTPVMTGASVWLTQTGRVELHATLPDGAGVASPRDGSARFEAYLSHDGVLRPLPLGSSFDAARGTFYWQPVAGFLGTYDLLILRLRGSAVDAAWTVPLVVGPDADRHLLQIDRAAAGGPGLSERSVRVEGWALDPQAADGSGIGMVHVWATRKGEASPVFLGSAGLGGHRTDVAASYGRQFEFSGYSLSTDALEPGEYEVVVYAWSMRTAAWAIAKTVTLQIAK